MCAVRAGFCSDNRNRASVEPEIGFVDKAVNRILPDRKIWNAGKTIKIVCPRFLTRSIFRNTF